MSNLGNGVCDHFTSDGIDCPPNMHSGLLTVAAADNVYYNHRTAISKNSCPGIYQNFSHAAALLWGNIWDTYIDHWPKYFW